MLKKFLAVVMLVAASVGVFAPLPVSAASDASCDASFLTFRPWYYGLTEGADCRIVVGSGDKATNEEITAFVWTIVLNVLSNLFSAVGYLAIGFIIYGGYMYVLARGSADKINKGKKIIISAIVGLVICILAAVITNTIVEIVIGAVGA